MYWTGKRYKSFSGYQIQSWWYVLLKYTADIQMPTFQKRIFICLDRKGAASSEHFYKQFYSEDITPWKKGNRPVFSKWQYNFNADDNGYLYDRNLDLVLDNTPWKYSQLKNYYQADNR